jgi:hypothetical protein
MVSKRTLQGTRHCQIRAEGAFFYPKEKIAGDLGLVIQCNRGCVTLFKDGETI